MDERKLNFSVPILSVRRTLSSAFSDGETGRITENCVPDQQCALSVYGSDMNSDQVTEAATVPFLWEQFPGRPKNHGGPLPLALEGPSLLPKIPPGKTMEFANQSSEKGSKDEVWLMTRFQALSPTESEYVGSFKERTNENIGSFQDDDEEVFSDAPETLSQTESFSVNCNVSGLNGSGISGLKVSEPSMDLKTRELMMSRFLPAAKAMTLEPPQYASRKKPVVIEQPRQAAKVDRPNSKMLPRELESRIVAEFGQEEEEEETDDEQDSLYDSGHMATKGCGFFHGLPFKNSLCMLNPVPGLKIRTQPTKSSTCEARKPGKATFNKSQSQVAIKHGWNSNLMQKSPSGKQLPKLAEVENKMLSRSKGFSFSGVLQTRASSPYRRTMSGNIFLNQKVAPSFPYREAGFLGMPKLVESHTSNPARDEKSKNKFSDVSSHQRTQKLSSAASSVAEKTLYVDAVHDSDSYSENNIPASQGVEAPVRPALEEKGASESSFQDAICLVGVNGRGTNVSRSVDTNLLAPPSPSYLRCQEDHNKGVQLEQGHKLKSSSPKCSSGSVSGNLDFYKEKNSKGDDLQKVNHSSGKSPLPPPLPKSPSESWLRRALPSVPSRNPLSHSHLGAQFHSRKQDSDPSAAHAKWERIVKSSKFHRDHGRYSEELIEHVPEQSKA